MTAQTVEKLPAIQETRDLSLGQEDPLEKGNATHSIILAWRISWTEEPGRLQSDELQSWTRLSNSHFIQYLSCQNHVVSLICSGYTCLLIRVQPCLSFSSYSNRSGSSLQSIFFLNIPIAQNVHFTLHWCFFFLFSIFQINNPLLRAPFQGSFLFFSPSTQATSFPMQIIYNLQLFIHCYIFFPTNWNINSKQQVACPFYSLFNSQHLG